MIVFIIVLLVIIAIILNNPNIYNKKNIVKENNLEQYDDLSNYTTKKYVMTYTELKFYRELKKITDELNLEIFPQINLERIIQIKDNNNKDRNRIKSRSIDYTIVKNKNCEIIACIELDDYTHNREKNKKNDEFKNKIFEKVNISLIRIKVQNRYNLEELKQTLIKLKN